MKRDVDVIYKNGSLCFTNKDAGFSVSLSELEFDSKLFGLKMGRITELSLGDIDLKRVSSFMNQVMCEVARLGFEHIIYKSPVENHKTNQLLSSLQNIIIVNGSIYFKRHIQRNIVEIYSDYGNVRHAEKNDEEQLVDLTADIFSDGTRFHVDDMLDKKDAVELHKMWIRNIINSPQKLVLVSEYDGRLIGYVTVNIDSNDNNGYIELIGVRSTRQRMGYAGNLLKCLFEIMAGSIESMSVDTEMDNYAAIGLYQKNKFKLIGCTYNFRIAITNRNY